jgi:hypothetical protein
MAARLREGDRAGADDEAGSGFAQRAQHGPRGAANWAQQGGHTTPSQPSPHSAQVDGSRCRTTAMGRRRSNNGKLIGNSVTTQWQLSGKPGQSVIGLFVDKQVHCRHYLI